MKLSARILRSVALVVLTVAAAYFLGTAVGNYVTERKAAKDLEAQAAHILETMENLAVGDTIPDHIFQNMSGRRVRLSDLLTSQTVITFFQPDCETCATEIDRLKAAIADTGNYRYFLFVSSFTKADLKEFIQGLQIPLHTLYDSDDGFASIFRVWTFPFNIVVDRNRKVLAIKPTALTKSDIKAIIKANEAVEGT